MFFKSLLTTTAVALFAAQAVAAPSAMTGKEMEAPNNDARAVLIAPDATNACNCPNNCRHRVGDSCKFYQQGYVVTATCQKGGANGALICE